MSKTFKISSALLTLALASLLAACQTTRTTVTGAANPDVCLIWQGIDYSGSKDTPETVAAIRVQNARHDSYCRAK